MCRVLIVLAAVCALAYGSHIQLPAPKLDGRIVGGVDAEIEELPYQLSLQDGGYHICGASIIGANWVLTAAHCVDGASARDISFRAGSSIRGQGGSVHQAVQITVHPKYNAWTTDFDFALVKVDEAFPLGNAGVQAITLTTSEPSEGEVATVSGWGTTSAGGSSPRQLKKVQVPIISRGTCAQKYQGYTITDRMICAGVSTGGKDSCQGDSGGPLAIGGKLNGVVSWGIGCASASYPGVYSNIANQRDWIRTVSGV